jgi:very-short-patch-repair endonuclease
MVNPIYNQPILKERRKDLRNTATLEERILWNYLKSSKMGYKFRRQASIGNYIADFFCPELSLVIELDGSQHLDKKEYDSERDSYLKSVGCTVLRFWNNQVHKNLDGVIMKIRETIKMIVPRFTYRL